MRKPFQKIDENIIQNKNFTQFTTTTKNLYVYKSIIKFFPYIVEI